ncbi:MAG TPA: hypothetical protein VMH05_00170 [Bryobacteraceae bacterium]|nr:hypothetical protein [Bryobacteraceae bacterium]
MTERVDTAPAGESTTHAQASKFYRDTAGRIRIERNLPELMGGALLIEIVDSGAGFLAMLIVPTKQAFRMNLPPKTPASSIGMATIGPGGVELAQEPGVRTSKTESLGKRTIEGLDLDASLTTITVEGRRTITGTDEQWGSKELGLIGFRHISALGVQTTSQIQNTTRTEPDPSLFSIPPDYSIQDETPQM